MRQCLDYTHVYKILLLSPRYETNYWSTALRDFKIPVELLWVWVVKVVRVLLDEQTAILTETVKAGFGQNFGIIRLSCICVGHDRIISVYITSKSMLWIASKAENKAEKGPFNNDRKHNFILHGKIRLATDSGRIYTCLAVEFLKLHHLTCVLAVFGLKRL